MLRARDIQGSQQAYPYPTDAEGKAVAVDLLAVRALVHPASLKSIKADTAFAGWGLVRIPRLSVMPASELQFKRILELAK